MWRFVTVFDILRDDRREAYIDGERAYFRSLVQTIDQNQLGEEHAVAVIKNYIEVVDSDVGIYARLLDKDFNRVTDISLSDLEEHEFIVFNKDNEFYDELTQRVKNEYDGEALVTVDGYDMEIYWIHYPKEDTEYYVVIGIINSIFDRAVETKSFTIGLLFMAITTLFSSYYTLYVDNKHKGKIK